MLFPQSSRKLTRPFPSHRELRVPLKGLKLRPRGWVPPSRSSPSPSHVSHLSCHLSQEGRGSSPCRAHRLRDDGTNQITPFLLSLSLTFSTNEIVKISKLK